MARAPQPTESASSEPKQAQATPTPGNALARTESRGSVLSPLDVGQTRQAMQTYQEGLTALLSDSDWQDAGRGEKFVKKSGWRKIAAWFSLNVEILAEEVTYAETDDAHARAKKGDPIRAKVIARAVAPNGRYADGDGRCNVNEKRFANEGARGKVDNDLPGTATTRAINRAISNLVGLGAVSGDEMDDDSGAGAGPPFGPPASEELGGKVPGALAFLADIGQGPDTAIAQRAGNKIVEDTGGYMPSIVARAILHLALEVRNAIEAASGGQPPAQEAAAQAQSGEPQPEQEPHADASGEANVEEVDGEIVPEGGAE